MAREMIGLNGKEREGLCDYLLLIVIAHETIGEVIL